jgi:hypothetical protein
VLEQQGYEQASHATVAVQVWMNRLELHVKQPRSHDPRRCVFAVDVPLERREQIGESMRRRGHVHGVARAAATDPVLTTAHFPRPLLTPTGTSQKSRVRRVEQPHREWWTPRICDLRARIGERVDIVADLFDVGRRASQLVVLSTLEAQEVDESGLGTLDLRGEHGLLPDERVDEPVERRDHLARQLEADQGVFGVPRALQSRPIHRDRWLCRRQRMRNEGCDLLTPNLGPLVSTRDPLRHIPRSLRAAWLRSVSSWRR